MNATANNINTRNNRRYNLSAVCNLAWTLVKKNGLSLKAAMKTAWANVKLLHEMHQRIVCFFFSKVDGTTRQAYGTLKADRVPATNGSGRKANPTVQVYFDIEKEEWRCFKKANLIRIA